MKVSKFVSKYSKGIFIAHRGNEVGKTTVLVHPQKFEILVKFDANDVICIIPDTINCIRALLL